MTLVAEIVNEGRADNLAVRPGARAPLADALQINICSS